MLNSDDASFAWLGISIDIDDQIERALTNAGCETAGPNGYLSEAIDLVVLTKPDAALLDVNLSGSRSFPVADILQAKGIPFAFCTGYAGASELPARFEDVRTIAKPFSQDALVRTIAETLAG